jgi:hypothetical protein
MLRWWQRRNFEMYEPLLYCKLASISVINTCFTLGFLVRWDLMLSVRAGVASGTSGYQTLFGVVHLDLAQHGVTSKRTARLGQILQHIPLKSEVWIDRTRPSHPPQKYPHVILHGTRTEVKQCHSFVAFFEAERQVQHFHSAQQSTSAPRPTPWR